MKDGPLVVCKGSHPNRKMNIERTLVPHYITHFNDSKSNINHKSNQQTEEYAQNNLTAISKICNLPIVVQHLEIIEKTREFLFNQLKFTNKLMSSIDNCQLLDEWLQKLGILEKYVPFVDIIANLKLRCMLI